MTSEITSRIGAVCARPSQRSAIRKKPWIAKRMKNAIRRSTIATDAPSGWPRSGPKMPDPADREEGRERDDEEDQPAAGGRIDEWQDQGERDDAGDEEDERRDRHQQLEPLERRPVTCGIAQVSGEDAEAEGDEEPRVEVAGRHPEPAVGESDVAPRPEAHPDRDRIEREVEHDDQHGIDERRVAASHAERIGDAHRAGDDQRPREADDDRRPVDGQQPVRRIVVRLEDQLVALLEQDAERGRADQLEEREAPASEREDGGDDEERGRSELEDDVERVHAPPS